MTNTVRFTRGPLGLMAGANDARFVEETVDAGDTGELLPVEDTPPLPEGWRMVRVTVDGQVRYAPVHPTQFEEA